MRHTFKDYYIGNTTELDEYQQQQINQILAKSSVVTLLLFILLGCIIRYCYKDIIIDYDIIIILAYIFYITFKSFKGGLIKTEFYSQSSYHNRIKQLKKTTMKYLLVTWLIFFSLKIFKLPIYSAKLVIQVVISSLIGAVISSTIYYYFIKKNLILVEDSSNYQDDILPIKDKFLYYSFGYTGGRDEYQTQQLYKILADAAIRLIATLLILSLSISIYALFNLDYGPLAYGLSIISVVNFVYISISIHNKKIISYTFYSKDMYQQAYQFLKERTLGIWFLTFVYVNIYMIYMTFYYHTTLWQTKIIVMLLMNLLVFLFVGWLLYMIVLSQIKLLENDNE